MIFLNDHGQSTYGRRTHETLPIVLTGSMKTAKTNPRDPFDQTTRERKHSTDYFTGKRGANVRKRHQNSQRLLRSLACRQFRSQKETSHFIDDQAARRRDSHENILLADSAPSHCYTNINRESKNRSHRRTVMKPSIYIEVHRRPRICALANRLKRSKF